MAFRPLQRLIKQIREFEASKFNTQLDGSDQPEEVQVLVAQFNGLLTRLALAYDQLENFNANVAR